MVAVLPLSRPRADELTEKDKDAEVPAGADDPPFGALIVEQIEDARLQDATVQRVNVVCRHSASALGNALEYRSLFLMPVWRALGKTRFITRARTFPKVLAIAGGVVLAILALIFVPAEYKVQATGTIEPRMRRDVFAKHDGNVDEVLVNHGETVAKGATLAKLQNTELDVTIAETTGSLRTAREEWVSVHRRLLEEQNRLRPEEQDRLSGKESELKQTISSLSSKLDLLLAKQKDLEVVSPTEGVVTTWDVRRHLLARPVQRGQVLMRVGQLDGEWELEIQMSEDRMGDIAKAVRDMAKAKGLSESEVEQAKCQPLHVAYILASQPGTSHEGTVREIEESAEVRGDEGNTVLIRADIDKRGVAFLAARHEGPRQGLLRQPLPGIRVVPRFDRLYSSRG